MPWKPSDAKKHTKKADTPKEQEKWAKTANSTLKKTGDEARAVRTANATIKQGK